MPAGTVHPRSQRSTSEASSNPPSRGTMAPSIGQSQTVNAQAMSHGHGAMAITSIIEHPVRGNELSMPGPSMGEVTHAGIGPIPPSFRPEWSYGPMGSADSPMYSSDCSSPMSDYPNAQMAYLQRPPSTFSDSSFHQQPVTSPLSAGPSYAPTWGTFDPAPAYDHFFASTVDPPLQLPFAHVDEQQWHPIRTQPVSTAAVAMGKSSLLKAQNPQTQHYLDRYWEYFHPLFPIVHFPSFMSTIPQPLLAASMVVIGAQYSPRPDAKQYSASLHAECAKLLSDVSTVCRNVEKGRGLTPWAEGTFDQSLFGFRSADQFSFGAVYSVPCTLGKARNIDQAQLIADQEFLQVDQASLHQTLPPPSAPAHLEAVYSRWVEHEIRRRILVAMFVLDTQHSHLFQRQSSYSGNLTKEDGLDLPFPTSTEIWNCPDVPTWRELIASHEAFSINTLGPNHHHHPPLDPFQSSLLTCCHVHRSRLSGTPTQYDLVYQPSKSHVHHAAAARTHHSLSMSTHAPLHALLITASESWLFGTKITDEAIWYRSKATLRKWVTGPGALKAVWHATRLLRLAIIKRDDSAPSREADDQGGCYYLHDPWCLYVAALAGLRRRRRRA
ncbi:MAG: hypothetical protein L6R40_006867 [Gallowayella cf. fulva]|nr:MAG: hypothetical protein L6R40_006867 [Xanthomendoza cf. fulva]